MPNEASIADEMRALEGGWCVTPSRCAICSHEWVAVWPLDLDAVDLDDERAVDEAMDEGIPNLQCSQCGQQGSTIERNLTL